MSKYPIVTYDFSEGEKKNPFDIDAEAKYFIYASGFTYLFNVIDLDAIAKVIPMGYKTLIIAERLTLIEAGEVVKDWLAENLNQSIFMLFSAASQEIKLYVGKEIVHTNTIYRPGNIYNSFKEAVWENYEECLSYAKKFSLTNSTDILETRVVRNVNWH
ncbi:hypothetical protein [Paenibacillus dakarensis]|uniref:hypothetical protein n=1 Tax=Paenibacillus dakarensis TaxID=1527293 RepID=UPI0006D5B780|nr:hypothetical protein [Paenibacillus dakarensis]